MEAPERKSSNDGVVALIVIVALVIEVAMPTGIVAFLGIILVVMVLNDTFS